MLSYGFTQALSERYDAYKKGLRASYSQGDNRYKATVVEAYQMALDVSRIYQKRRKNFNEKNERDNDKDEGGTSFLQKEEKKKAKGQCFKCGAKDYKTCPCDNLKKNKSKEKEKSEEAHTHHAEEKHVSFDDAKVEASFHQMECEEVEMSARVVRFCNQAHNDTLA